MDCEHASHYIVDLSHTDVTINSRPHSALSYLNMLSSDMISDELEIHTIDKSNYKLVPLYSSEDIMESKVLSQSPQLDCFQILYWNLIMWVVILRI